MIRLEINLCLISQIWQKKALLNENKSMFVTFLNQSETIISHLKSKHRGEPYVTSQPKKACSVVSRKAAGTH